MRRLWAKNFSYGPPLVNSRIQDIDACAGYNDRGAFSNEPLYFAQELAKDFFRFSSRVELFHPFFYKKKASLF